MQFDFTNALAELDAGTFVAKISRAVQSVALGTVDYDGKGKLVIELNFRRIGESRQVDLSHKLKFEQPTLRGKAMEEDTTSTQLYVGHEGAISVTPEAQGHLFGEGK